MESNWSSKQSRYKDNCRNANMDDILILTAKQSERAILWANFLKTRFDKITKQRGRKPFNFLHIKIDDGTLTPEVAQICLTTPLQIVILCPALMALPHSFLMTQLSTVLNPDKVLGILLEVPEKKVLEIHDGAFPYFRRWRRCEVRSNDQSLIGNILGIATDILGRALCQRPPCQDSNGAYLKNGHNTELFTVVPRKVKIGQNKVLALLNDPLTKDDWIKITIEKAGEFIDVTSFKRRNPYTIQFNVPESCMEISTMVDIHIQKNEKDLGSRPIKCESRLRELEQLLRTQDSPLEFMCHSLGIGATERDALDLHLLQCFQKNMPPNFHLLAGPFEKQNHLTGLKNSNPEEYPTLLHFAAKWGLERLCIQLLECPGGDAACEIKNYAGKTPAEIAETEGFAKLCKSLKGFSQMHEFATMYHYFKGINDSSTAKITIEPKIDSPKIKSPKTESKKEISQAEYMEMSSSGSEAEASVPIAVTNLNYINIEPNDDCNLMAKKVGNIKITEDSEVLCNELRINEPPYYQSNDTNKTDDFSQECSNVLENCSSANSSSSQSDYILQPSNVPVSAASQSDYMTHPSNRPVEFVNYINDHMSAISSSNHEDDSHLKMKFEKKKNEIRPFNYGGTLKRTGSDASKGNADDELAEIMYDFKNNVLTIREVEQLVEKWKNRNDVKQSFKEKQEQIEKMREEYDRIQEQMKERMKRPTPFERVKKLFSRSKSKCHNDDTDEMKSSVTSIQSSHRPTSSLSLQSVSSSSSSGRMSTGSACSGASLGDSGTHSDHEDRRQMFVTNCRLGSPGSLMDNYLIPPAPRPVITPASTPTPVEEKDRPTFTNNRAITPTSLSEHYILFPSNVPVFPSPVENHNNETMTFCGLNTIVEAKETTNETSATVQPIKVQTNDIIYSQIQRKNDTCTSFKTPANGQDLTIKDVAKRMSDVYQNINGTDKKACTDGTKVPLQKIDSTGEEDETHNYMNV